MAYFNKTDFRQLVRLWRRVMKDSEDELTKHALLRDDEWLMTNWLPIRFIDEIEREMKKR